MDLWQALLQIVEQKPTSNPVVMSEDKQIERAQVAHAEREKAMLGEEMAFRKLHPLLSQQYAGKYVAIYNEQLIDSDANQGDLYRRVHKQHPDKFIWIAPVNESPDEVLLFRSPRFLKSIS